MAISGWIGGAAVGSRSDAWGSANAATSGFGLGVDLKAFCLANCFQNLITCRERYALPVAIITRVINKRVALKTIN